MTLSSMLRTAVIICALLSITTKLQAQHWTRVFGPFGGDVEAINSDGNRIYAGTDSGVFVSSNFGVDWTRSAKGLDELETFSIGVTRTGTVLTGSEGDGIFRSTDFGETWEGSDVGLAPNENILSLASAPHASTGSGFIAAGSSRHGIYVSEDDGKSWVSRAAGMPDTTAWSITIGPNNTIFVGMTGAIAASTNKGVDWTYFQVQPGEEVLALAADSSGRVFAGSTAGRVYMTEPGGTTFMIANADAHMGRPIKSLACHGSTVLAGLLGAGIWASDAGNHWQSISDTLQNASVYAITFVPNGPSFEEEIYIGTLSAEVYRSALLDGVRSSETWQETGFTCVPNPVCNDATLRFPVTNELAVSGIIRIEVLNALGSTTRTLYYGPSANSPNELHLDRRDLSPGVNFVRVVREGTSENAPTSTLTVLRE